MIKRPHVEIGNGLLFFENGLVSSGNGAAHINNSLPLPSGLEIEIQSSQEINPGVIVGLIQG